MTDSPVKINEKRCKSCAKCVRVCPAGVLVMKLDPHSIYGIMVSVDRIDLCIGCDKCAIACPDFAIRVEEKKGKDNPDGYPYPKLSAEARERQAKILANDCQSLPEEGEKK